METRYRSLAALTALAFATAPAGAFVEDFSSLPPGTVVSGPRPGGSTADGTALANMTVSAVNNGDGPNSSVIFDSSNPTGGDIDLGSPNDTCDDGLNNGTQPGQGAGGEAGQPGENCVAKGHLLLVSDNIAGSPSDMIVDDPGDEPGGGSLRFDFDFPSIIQSVCLMDIDEESTNIVLTDEGMVEVSVDASALGDNSVEEILLQHLGAAVSMQVNFTSSGAVCDFEYEFAPVPTTERSWSQIKSTYLSD